MTTKKKSKVKPVEVATSDLKTAMRYLIRIVDSASSADLGKVTCTTLAEIKEIKDFVKGVKDQNKKVSIFFTIPVTHAKVEKPKRIVEYSVREIDKNGDSSNLHHYETEAEATTAARWENELSAALDLELIEPSPVKAVVVEKNVITPNDPHGTRKVRSVFGSTAALVAGGWIEPGTKHYDIRP